VKTIRNPERIKEVTQALEECWSKFPDLRFGQLFVNIYQTYANGRDPFFPEDDQWLEWINKYKDEYMSKYI
jgi:uncharacterized protein YihD (DUF1040 family)